MRIFQPIPFQVSQTIFLDPASSHHIARVLRAKIGDELILFNNGDEEYLSIIERIDKKNVQVKIVSKRIVTTESTLQLHLAQGIAKGEKMDWIIQKAVELGVTTVTPIITEHCNVRLDSERSEKRLQHWQGVAIHACEQSGRTRVPKINEPVLYSKWLTTIAADYLFVLSPDANEKLTIEKLNKNSSMVLLTGPEGGLSESEINAAREHKFVALNLGPRILRTETASVAALAILQYFYGDL